MVDNKTGILFYLISVLCLISKDNPVFIDEILLLAKFFGRFYQIRDDYINITNPSYWKNKGFCEDFDEKKCSYIFARLKQLSGNSSIFENVCKYDNLTQENKIEFYTQLYQTKILHQIYFDLDKYKQYIIETERKITKDKSSEFLNTFFKKLYYNLPIEPKNIKTHLIFNKLKEQNS